MSINTTSKSIFEKMQEFIDMYKTNPISDAAIVIGKDLNYVNQDANEAYMLLCPIAEQVI